MLKATSISVKGAPSSSGFVYAEEFIPDNSERLVTHGRLFCLVASYTHSVDLVPAEVGREILESVKKEYYGSTSKAFNSLKQSLEKVASKFALTWGEVEIVAASFVSGVVYSAVWGRSEVSILRGKMLASLLKGRGEIVSASGYPEEGDCLVLATKDFAERVPQYSLKEILATGEPAVFQTKFSNFYSAEGPLYGALIVLFKNEAFSEEFLPTARSERLNKITESIKGFKTKISGLFKRGVSERKIYIREPGFSDYEAGSKKTTLTVGIILISLLFVSILFGIRQKNIKEIKSRYESRLTQALHEFEESQSLFSINPERSRELFLNSRELAEALRSEGVKDSSLEDLYSKIISKTGQILGEYKIELENFVDLSLVSSGFRGSDIASSGEEVFVLDASLKRVVKVNLATKRSEVVAGADDFSGGNQIVAYEDRVFVVGQDGIKELSEDNNIEKSWDGEVLVYSYAANLYVLEKNTSSIWRFAGSSDGFGSKQSWLGSGLNLDFSDAKSFAIDGSMWILDSEGSIFKLTFGTVDTFRMSGLPGNLVGAVSVYTNEDLENVYVLDPADSRIVVFDKSGEFKVQYISEDLKRASDLVTNEKEGKAVVLVDGNLKSLKLSQ